MKYCWIVLFKYFLPVNPSLWLRMKYLSNYWMDCQDILYRHSWSSEDESHWLLIFFLEFVCLRQPVVAFRMHQFILVLKWTFVPDAMKFPPGVIEIDLTRWRKVIVTLTRHFPSLWFWFQVLMSKWSERTRDRNKLLTPLLVILKNTDYDCTKATFAGRCTHWCKVTLAMRFFPSKCWVAYSTSWGAGQEKCLCKSDKKESLPGKLMWVVFKVCVSCVVQQLLSVSVCSSCDSNTDLTASCCCIAYILYGGADKIVIFNFSLRKSSITAVPSQVWSAHFCESDSQVLHLQLAINCCCKFNVKLLHYQEEIQQPGNLSSCFFRLPEMNRRSMN